MNRLFISIAITSLILLMPLSAFTKDKYIEISTTELCDYAYSQHKSIPPSITALNDKKIKLTYAVCYPSKKNKKKYLITNPSATMKISYGQKIMPSEVIIGHYQSKKSITPKAFSQLLTIWGRFRIENTYDKKGKLISLFKIDVEDYVIQGTTD